MRCPDRGLGRAGGRARLADRRPEHRRRAQRRVPFLRAGPLRRFLRGACTRGTSPYRDRRPDCRRGVVCARAHRQLLDLGQPDGGARGSPPLHPRQLLGADDLTAELPGPPPADRAAHGVAAFSLSASTIAATTCTGWRPLTPSWASHSRTWAGARTWPRAGPPCPMLSLTCASARSACSPARRRRSLGTRSACCAAGPLDKIGMCCINMDYGTPDDNIFAVYEVVERYRRG